MLRERIRARRLRWALLQGRAVYTAVYTVYICLLFAPVLLRTPAGAVCFEGGIVQDRTVCGIHTRIENQNSHIHTTIFAPAASESPPPSRKEIGRCSQGARASMLLLPEKSSFQLGAKKKGKPLKRGLKRGERSERSERREREAEKQRSKQRSRALMCRGLRSLSICHLHRGHPEVQLSGAS